MRRIEITSAPPPATSLRSTMNDLHSQIASFEILELFYEEYDDVSNLPHKWAISAAEAKALALVNMKRLGNDRSETRKLSLKLARKLKKCQRGQRCGSAACPKCDRAFQRMMVDWSKRFTKQLPDGTTFWIGTIVPPFKYYSVMGEAALVDRQARFYKRLHRAFKQHGVIAAFGALDLSANEHSTTLFEPHYRPHLWAILVVKFEGSSDDRISKRNTLTRELTTDFPSTELINYPVVLQDFDGKPECFPYGFKSWWCIRSRRVTSSPVTDDSGNTVSRQNTKGRSLRKQQFIEVLHLADQLGFAGRLFVHPEQTSRIYIPRPGGYVTSDCK